MGVDLPMRISPGQSPVPLGIIPEFEDTLLPAVV